MNAEQKKALGGSDIAAIMGASKYASAYDVWLRVTGRHDKGDNEILKRGRRFEPVVRQIAEEDLNLRIRLCEPIVKTYNGVMLRASVDGLIDNQDGTVEIFEAKTSNEFMRHQWGDEAPLAYQLQIQWYMMMYASSKAHLVALIGLDDVRHYTIEADVGLQRRMMEAAQAFWRNHVETDSAPPMSATAGEYLDDKYPVTDGGQIEATEEIEAVVDELCDVRRDLKELEEREEKLKNTLKDYIGEAKTLKTQFATVTWSASQTREVVDYKAILKEANVSGDIIQRHTCSKLGSRVFRIVERSA